MAKRDVKARYAEKLDALIARGDRLTDRELRGLFRLLNEARREVRNILGDQPTEWQQAHFAALKQRLEKLMVDVGRDMGRDLRDLEGDRWQQGRDWTDDMLRDFGGETALAGTPLDRRMLSILEGFGTDLITHVSQKVIDDVSTAVQLGLMAKKTPYEIMQEIAAKLVDENGKPLPGPFGDALRRAEVIYTTEAGRAFSVAQDTRMHQWDKDRPGLLKTWKHGHASIQPRASHLDAEDRYSPGGSPGPIPMDEPFVIVVRSDEATKSMPAGDYSLMYPRDPGAPAGLTISCRCSHGPWREGWEDL